MYAILFHEQKRVSWFRDRNKMRALLSALFRKEKTDYEQVQFVFMSDDELLAINQQFLQHDYFTDIITFDLSASKSAPKVADIYISIDRVADNAKDLGVGKAEELRRVMIHGCLHLCGYKDKLNRDKAVMRAREDHYLHLYEKRST